MNTAESQLTYPFGDALPQSGSAMHVAPGIKWIRMGLPFALDHINLWLVRDRQDGMDGWTVVDCCVDLPEARAQWEALFANHLDGLPVLRVFATHMHPDHLGLAHWLCERWDVQLSISATDYYTALAASTGTLFPNADALGAFYRSHGVTDASFHQRLNERGSYYPALVPKIPPVFHRVMDGDVIDIGDYRFVSIAGYGHAPEHMALSCQEHSLLISGDMVLPRISTNISVFAGEPEANPLSLFLASLRRYEILSNDTLVLPSHGKPFRGLHERLMQLHDHHEAQLLMTHTACVDVALCAAELVPILFKRTLDNQQLTFALGEALAHLHYLWRAGGLKRERDDQGVYRFSTV